jgi:methylase of polypeptide subunit release factors
MLDDSLFLCEHLLQQYHLPTNTIPSLIDFPKAKQASVLELGAGTGLCSVLLNEMFGAWIATDQYDNLKLIQRNLRENKLEDRVRVLEVDWFHSLQKRKRRDEEEEYDLVLAVDCIYNEALIKPLIATFDRYATRSKTLVWVVIELRSSDVVSA